MSIADRLLSPEEAQPVPIHQGAIARSDDKGDRHEVLLLVDLTDRPDVLELIERHRLVAEGECSTVWGRPPEDQDHIWLLVHFTKPLDVMIILAFDISREGLVIDELMRKAALRLLPGSAADDLKELSTKEHPHLSLEVNTDFTDNWQRVWIEAVSKRLKVSGEAAERLIHARRREADFALKYPDAPPLHKVVDIFPHPAEEALIFVTDDMLINQIRRDNPLVAVDFDPKFEHEIKIISRDFSETAGLILRAMIADSDSGMNRVLGALLSNAINAVPAAIDLIRLGYRLQPAATLRVALETTAVAAQLFSDDEKVAAFLSGKLKSSQAIGPAKKIVPFIGSLYGYLSEQFTHVGPLFGELQKNTPYDEQDIGLAKTNLLVVQGTLLAIGITSELAFFENAPAPRYWIKRDEGVFELSLREDVSRMMQYLSERLSFGAEGEDTQEDQESD